MNTKDTKDQPKDPWIDEDGRDHFGQPHYGHDDDDGLCWLKGCQLPKGHEGYCDNS